MADISLRKWIHWLPHSPSESTSTIVLTSPQRRFVDIRALLSLPSSSSDSNLPLEQLEWAIAGNSTSSPIINPTTKEVEYSHCVWHHWIDSRVNSQNVPADEGDNYEVEGHPELTLEKGRMVNPDSGTVQDYEEMWEAGRIEGVGGVECLVLVYDPENRDIGEWARDHEEWAGDHEGEVEQGAKRGLVIRLGGYVQGFLRYGEDIRVERWVWDEGKGIWESTIRIGSGRLKDTNGAIPVEFVTEVGGQMEIGDEVFGESGSRWRVVEKSLA